jgi:hypothetical protein
VSEAEGFEIETALNLRALKWGLNVAEIPSFEARRVNGESKLRAVPDGMRILKTIFKEWAEGMNWSFWKNLSASLRKRRDSIF